MVEVGAIFARTKREMKSKKQRITAARGRARKLTVPELTFVWLLQWVRVVEKDCTYLICFLN